MNKKIIDRFLSIRKIVKKETLVVVSTIFISISVLVFGLAREASALSGSGKVKILVSSKDGTRSELFDGVKRITIYHKDDEIVLLKLIDKNNKEILINFHNIVFFEYDLDNAIPVIVKDASELHKQGLFF